MPPLPPPGSATPGDDYSISSNIGTFRSGFLRWWMRWREVVEFEVVEFEVVGVHHLIYN
jgi:hypothetical protein